MKSMLLTEPNYLRTWAQWKEQTRRLLPSNMRINDNPDKYKCNGLSEDGAIQFEDLKPEITPWMTDIKTPWKEGDVLYLKEPFTYTLKDNGLLVEYHYNILNDEKTKLIPFDEIPDATLEKVKNWRSLGRKTSKLFMHEFSARRKVVIKKVRVERLQDISWDDAIAEGMYNLGDKKLLFETTGVDDKFTNDPIYAFETLWDSINPEMNWEYNPWVIVYDYSLTNLPF